MKPITLDPGHAPRVLTGVPEAAAGFVTARLLEGGGGVCLLLARTQRQLEAWAEDLLFFLPGDDGRAARVLLFPELAEDDGEGARAFTAACDRLTALTALREHPARAKRPLVLATTPAALLQPVPDPEQMAGEELRLAPGRKAGLQAIATQLAERMGYETEVLCESPGQMAVRGGLVDVYPFNAASPVRIDFFGDEIESIRAFDPTSQRSGEPLEALTIAPAGNGEDAGRSSLLSAYLPNGVSWFVLEPPELEDAFPDIFAEPERMRAPGPNLRTLLDAREECGDTWTGLVEIDASAHLFPESAERVEVPCESLEAHRPTAASGRLTGVDRVEAEQRGRAAFLEQLLRWQEQGEQLLFVCRTEGEESRLKELLAETEAWRRLRPHFRRGGLGQGFRIRFSDTEGSWKNGDSPASATALVAVTDNEIFGRKKPRVSRLGQRALPQRSSVDQLLDFAELADGDYLVHLQHGVCIFRGLQRLDTGKGEREEVISLEFAEKVTLHVRLHEAHLLSRYVGLTKLAPKLGKLGTNTWEKTRAAAERATLDFAGKLLTLQANRETRPGLAFSPDTPWQKEFEASFEHTETPDQLAAIEQAKRDMEQPRPMDRLICGDVGFGKTEVALRAAFKAAVDGYQVAVLAPTTVLTQQHFNTFRERMADYPLVVEMLSSFRTPAQRKAILAQIAAGRIDIVVGTHALLGRNVHFARLGLLIIDEEHRFGVRQKEKIKELSENVDVLTMSATPIPRTLHFALMGLRDLSVIETAPRDRLPIQTVVKGYDPRLVREVIRHEVGRGGQVFYLHNRVQTIETVANGLREMLPELRIGVGHGQMSEGELETVMTRFVAGHFDVLVCTTIIESGLDIPNCNTLIIDGADRFGLSQLYQLRGRVGRFNRQAYAYLLLHRHARLLDQARKRLNALRQHNQLGAGFRIAMRDLELRGAGNLLGSEQSGHIAGVGFELYCQLLRQSIARMKGEKGAAAIRASLRLDFVTVGESTGEQAATTETAVGYGALKEEEMRAERIERIDACLPAAYIAEPRLRIDSYRRLAMAATLGEVAEIREGLGERFGKPPREVEALVLTTEIRILAQDKGIQSVETQGGKLLCRLATRKGTEFVKTGNRFPRLTRSEPLARLREIRKFLNQQVDRFQ